jgi:hypothetical protein
MYCLRLSPWYSTIGPSATTMTSTQFRFDCGGQVDVLYVAIVEEEEEEGEDRRWRNWFMRSGGNSLRAEWRERMEGALNDLICYGICTCFRLGL